MSTNNIGEILPTREVRRGPKSSSTQYSHTIDPTGETRPHLSTVSRLTGAAAGQQPRAGRFAEADELLSEAADGFREIHATSFSSRRCTPVSPRPLFSQATQSEALHERRGWPSYSSEADQPQRSVRSSTAVRGYAYPASSRVGLTKLPREFEQSIEAAR